MAKKSVFKTYDIRGIYPTDLDSEFAFKLGIAFSKYLDSHNISKKIVVGRDFRKGSDEMSKSFIDGCIYSGAEIYDLGLCPTPCIYYMAQFYSAGVMITASHNPREYNGFKFCLSSGLIIGYENGLNEVEAIFSKIPSIKNIFNAPSAPSKIGKYFSVGLHKYIGEIIGKFKGLDFSRIKIVVDSGNGVAASTYLEIFQKLKIKYFPLNLDLDSNFGGRGPNPLLPNALDQLKEQVLLQKADLGIAFDGDSDRLIVVDNLGETIDVSIVGKIIAKEYFETNANFVLDIRLSKSLTEYLYAHGGNVNFSKVGQVFIKRKMIETNSSLGIEMSGHIVHKNLNYSDDAIYSSLLLLKQISFEKAKNFRFKLNDLHQNLKKYFIISEDISFSNTSELTKSIQKIQEKYYTARMDFTDGITLNYSNWWANIRPSNTEPLLRITLEADTEKIATEKLKELLSLF